MLSIYVDNITPRCKYTFDFFFANNNIKYQLISCKEDFSKINSSKFNYSEHSFQDCIQITSSTLLFESGIYVKNIECGKFENEDCLSFNKITDPFATVFYILSRMEEYDINKSKDVHDRFQATYSVNYRFNFLDKLICDRLVKAVISFLHNENVLDREFQKKELKLIPTFDIDNAFAYSHKTMTRQILAICKDLASLNFTRVKERYLTLIKNQPDPFDTFGTIVNISKNYTVNVFWLLGNRSKYDRNLRHNNKFQSNLIKTINKTCVVGIHPSYVSNSDIKIAQVEIHRLENIINRPVTNSRQHFLKLSLPHTYQNLINCGIKNDYSMGYADKIGFRAGTLTPYYWFDLSNNCITDLLIHPFAYMDGTLKDYCQFDIETSKKEIQKLYEEAKQFGGEFIFIWHNDTIGNYKNWKGWKQVLEYTLNLK